MEVGERKWCPVDAREATRRGLDIYRKEMRLFIRQALQARFGEAWVREEVAPLFSPDKRRQILHELSEGVSPERLVDIGDFGRVIAEHRELFPEAIRDGQPHDRFAEISSTRNRLFAHDAGISWHRADAESILAACGDILRQCGLLAGAQEIEDIAQQLQCG